VIAADVVIRGAGARASVLVGVSGATLLRVAPPEGARAAVSIARLGLRFNAPASADSSAVEAVGSGARLSLDEVEITQARDGVRVDRRATVCAQALTVRGSLGRGVVLFEDSHGYFRNVLVQGSREGGILAVRSHVDATRPAVLDNGRDGLALRDVRSGAACDRDEDCVDTEPPCPGFTHAQTCVARIVPGGSPPMRGQCRSTDQLVDLVARGNQVTALRAERPDDDRSRWGEPGPVVRGTRLVLTGTRVPTGLTGGDGLYVGAGAHVTLDSELMGRGDAARGLGSAIVGTTRTGILVDGDRRTGPVSPGELRQSGWLAVDGALIGSNRGPGLFVQEDSTVARVAFSTVDDNRALGIGVTTSGSVAEILCDQCINTRLGTLETTGGSRATFTVGDGLSMSEGTGGPRRSGGEREVTAIAGSEFSGNGRFGIVVAATGVSAQLRSGNTGSRNGLSVPQGSLDALGVSPGSVSPIAGLAPAPTDFVIASGTLNATR
jgi:hypothetical protein